MPFRMALARTASSLTPAPSSEIWMMTSLPVSWAERRISPTGSFPAAMRSSTFSSMPWSMEFRTMCMMGSPMESTMVLSTSVFSPTRVSFT